MPISSALRRLLCCAFWLSLLAFSLAGCRPAVASDFAIYLPAEEMTGPQIAKSNLRGLALQSKPLIGPDDIIAYDLASHTLTLTEAAGKRLANLKAGVYGRAFVVCVGAERIYAGAFWPIFSSVSFDGIIIELPPHQPGIAQIALGYPSAQYHSGPDPRDDARIVAALKRAGKLQ